MRAPWNGAARVLDGKATAAALKAELKERVTALRERLDRGAEITWVQDGTHHVHSTHCPERFVKELDLDAISGLTITRPTLEETYLSLVSSKEPQS